MNLFQLSNKEEDKAFLSGIPVLTRVAIGKKDQATLVPGSRIVIMLSNHQKHMGRIVSVDIVLEEPARIGEMTIIRASISTD